MTTDDLVECSTCVFWKYEGDHVHIGRCQRYPPTLMETRMPTDPDLAADILPICDATEWPATCNDEWCGEWKLCEDQEELAQREQLQDEAAADWIQKHRVESTT